MIAYDDIRQDLLIHAKALGIPEGAADDFIKRSLVDAKKAVADKTIITKADLERAVATELKKYNADLAYVFKNRDKII